MVDHLNPFYIRKANTEDEGAIRRIFSTSIKEHAPGFYDENEINAWLENASKLDLKHAMTRGEIYWVGGARSDSDLTAIAGFAAYAYKNQRAYVDMLYTDPGLRVRGLGCALLKTVEGYVLEQSQGQGGGLWVQSSLNAQGFYVACGYETVHAKKVKVHGIKVECLDMYKRL